MHFYRFGRGQDAYAGAMTTADEFAERLLQSSLGFVDVLAAHLGDRLGWYRALAAGGPATPA